MIKEVKAQLDSIITRHERPCLWASGGKDSLTLAHLLKDHAERVTVLHLSMGDDGFPCVSENLYERLIDWGYRDIHEVSPPLSLGDYWQQFGFPVDVVPTRLDGTLPTPFSTGVKLSSWWHCTLTRTIFPLIRASLDHQADAVIVGSRHTDAPRFADMATATDWSHIIGWVRYDPLIAWSDADVWAYVDTHEIKVPPIYAHKRQPQEFEWPDCKQCSWQPGYLLWLKDHDRQSFDALMAVAGPAMTALLRELGRADHDLWQLLVLSGVET